jgi:hypothetical protein
MDVEDVAYTPSADECYALGKFQSARARQRNAARRHYAVCGHPPVLRASRAICLCRAPSPLPFDRKTEEQSSTDE